MDQFVMLMRDEHFMLTDEHDDQMLTKLIMSIDPHAPRVVEVEPLLQLISEILKLSSTTNSKGGRNINRVQRAMESLKNKISSDETFEGLAKDLHTISCKISHKCTGKETGDENTVSVLIETLSSYSWEAKLVLVMTAFAVSYGGFFFSLRVIGTEKWIPLKKLGELIPAMVNLTESFIKAHKELPSDYPLSSMLVRTAVYWTIRSVVACVPHIFGFLGLLHEYTPSDAEEKELCKLVDKLVATNKEIQAQVDLYHRLTKEKAILEYCHKLELLFQQTGSDNMISILKLLIGVQDDNEEILFDIYTQNRLGVQALAKKKVLLLVSWELTIYSEEIRILVDRYTKTTQASEYQLVCFPMRKPGKTQREEFEQHVRSKNLPWYLVYERSMKLSKYLLVQEHDDYLITQAVLEYIQAKWYFNDRPILAVLNSQGKLISKNAFNNLRILGTTTTIDISFTLMTVEECWSRATWGLQLLFQSIQEAKEILEWTTNSNQLICLYGGEDANWVTSFEEKALAVMGAFHVRMACMGARYQTKKVQQRFVQIKEERQSLMYYCSQELASQFWVQIEIIEQFRTEFIVTQNGSIAEEKDDILNGIRSLLTYGSSEKGWAVICLGSKIVAQAKGNVILDCFGHYTKWKNANRTEDSKEFIKVLIDSVRKYDNTTHCNHLMMPQNNFRIPKNIRCLNCPKLMKKFIMYRCCND